MTEHRDSETRKHDEGVRKLDSHSRKDERSLEVAADRASRAREPIPKREGASWFTWQSALYLLVLGWICLVLVPLTSFWWLALICGMVMPIVLGKPGLPFRKLGYKKARERELLEALSERGEITATIAAMRTSLTVDQASKLLEELARNGHLRVQIHDGVRSYALQQQDREEMPGEVSTSLAEEPESTTAREQLKEPLSERELEVLNLLASGKTNAEIAGDLFISIGTVKSHTNSIYRKLDARNRAGALARARDLGLL